jgi:hypothetical protein
MDSNITKQPMTNDPFLQRAIEYWLDSANELGYQPLFCEWLITQGYVLKYSIKNTNFEQGKDVVAISKDGVPHGYQLKGGKIDLKRWRDEVKPEIDVMIDSAIQHPDIDKNKPHVSYLVTNGEIDDSVRAEIVAINEKGWKGSPLHLWTRGDLLSGFQTMSDGILPKDAKMYKRLTDLIFADGTGQPDIAGINDFLQEILDIKNATLKKEQRRRDIAAAMLYGTMIAGPYRMMENHTSVVRVMTLLLSLIFYVVDKYSLEDKYWIGSYEIIWDDILNTAKLLETEVNTKGFDPSFTDAFGKDLIPFRKHSAVSVIYPLKLAQYISGDEDWKTMLAPSIIEKYKGSIPVWGETSLIIPIFIALIFKDHKEAQASAIKLTRGSIIQIIEYNGRKSKNPVGLVSTYFDIDFAVKVSCNMINSEFDDKYKGGSYLLKSLVEILIRLGQRNFIAEQWQEISFFHFEEFIPSNPIDFYLWRIEKGENLSTLPKKEKSWKELVTETERFDGRTLPPTIKRFPAFLPFFLSLCPYRANSESIGFLYKISTR